MPPGTKAKHNKTICPAPEQIVELKLTKRRHEGIERFFVPYPILRGPRPCLIEMVDPKRVRYLRDAVIVLPVKVPSGRPFRNQLYSAALAVIETQYYGLIGDKLTDAGFMESIPESTVQSPYQSPVQREARKTLRHALKTPSLPDVVGETLTDALVGHSFWTPWILAEDKVLNNPRWYRRWSIVQNWERWQETQPPLTWEDKWYEIYPMRKRPLAVGKAVAKLDCAPVWNALRDECDRMGLLS